jgi:hypothetical protein
VGFDTHGSNAGERQCPCPRFQEHIQLGSSRFLDRADFWRHCLGTVRALSHVVFQASARPRDCVPSYWSPPVLCSRDRNDRIDLGFCDSPSRRLGPRIRCVAGSPDLDIGQPIRVVKASCVIRVMSAVRMLSDNVGLQC